jgi:hypothetical protein
LDFDDIVTTVSQSEQRVGNEHDHSRFNDCKVHVETSNRFPRDDYQALYMDGKKKKDVLASHSWFELQRFREEQIIHHGTTTTASRHPFLHSQH